jgi:flagellar biosynthetic protein FliQ
MMATGRALGFLNEMLWNSLMVAGPIMLATLAVGLLISIFQVTTQIQEMTLSYVPKILVAALMLIAIGPWMMGRITTFATSLYLTIPTLAG